MGRKTPTHKSRSRKTPEAQPGQATGMNRRTLLLGGGAALGAAAIGGTAWLLAPSEVKAGEMVVYRSPTCGCCGKWAKHMQDHGYTVHIRNVDDLVAEKDKVGVPEDLQSCHTAIIDGYVIEGHVPAREVTRLLKERPKAAGISVPGMPIGSPGMEGGEPERYNVVLFDRAGKRKLFARY